MTESAAYVLDELRRFLNDSLAAVGFAWMGLRQVPALFAQMPTYPENPDPDIFLGVGDPNDPNARTFGVWSKSAALQVTANGGFVDGLLSRQWIVYVFTAWEHDFRLRLASAHGCDPSAISVPLLGDLRRLRNDVVHHHGVASAANSGKCELLGHWAHVGDLIILDGSHFAEFWSLMPWEELAAAPGTALV